MVKAARPILQKLLSPQWRPFIFATGALAVIGLIILLWPPQRSAAAYCKIWDEGAKQLQNRDSVSHASEYVTFYSRLERVAPEEIRGDARVQKLVYQKIAKDPTQALSASLSGISANSNVNEWSRSHCTSGKVLNQ